MSIHTPPYTTPKRERYQIMLNIVNKTSKMRMSQKKRINKFQPRGQFIKLEYAI
jgi:hypothetical protein